MPCEGFAAGMGWFSVEVAGINAVLQSGCRSCTLSPHSSAMVGERVARTLSRLLAAAFVLIIVATIAWADTPPPVEGPTFNVPISNVTIPVGREAVLACVVEELSTYKVAWLRVDTQTILTIAIHVITKNHRIGVTHSDRRTWYLHIREVRESDHGYYMCQINTDPMKSQIGYLEVVVPPDILDYPTSTDMVVREGSNVTLRCAATGSPAPNITWRREGGELIPLGKSKEVASIEGSVFNITRVNRLHMGAYLCIASNGVPPTVSKRIMLIVHFPPMIWIQNQLVGAREGQQMTLECLSEAYPKSINYWTRDKGGTIANGEKYEPVLLDNAYKIQMKLTIRAVGPSDYGSYKCVSKNSLGETDGSIKLYHIPSPSTQPRLSSTTPIPIADRVEKKQRPRQQSLPSSEPGSNEIIDASQSAANREGDIRLRGRSKDNGGGGGSDGPQDDNAAQSMSSQSSALISLASSEAVVCFVLFTTIA